MQAYIMRRILLMIPTLLGVTIVVFSTLRFIPGDVADVILGPYGANQEIKQRILDDLGLDEPVYEQYFRYLGQLGQGDLGHSIISGRPISQELQRRLPVTIEMGILAMLFSLIIALPIGILSAVRQDSIIDYAARTFAIGLLAIPNFFLGVLLLILMARQFHWVPPAEYVAITEDPVENLKMMFLPSLVLGAALAGSVMRFTRTQMLEVMRQDYVRTAWAKGLRERTVIVRHALKNAFIPVVTVVGLQVPVILGGSLIIEQIFSIPGIGRYFIGAMNSRDYPVVQSVNLMIALFIISTNLVVDLVYAFLDPRIRYS